MFVEVLLGLHNRCGACVCVCGVCVCVRVCACVCVCVCVEDIVVARRLRWLGHLARMDDRSCSKLICIVSGYSSSSKSLI